MTKKHHKDDDDDLMRELDEGVERELAKREKTDEKADAHPTTLAEVPPGCSAPDTVPPSVVGTSQDPNRKTE